MINKIVQINKLTIGKLSLPHFVGLMEFTDKEVSHFFSQPGMDWPVNVKKQFDVFHAAYQQLDEAYCNEAYSLLTEKIKQANQAGWRIFMGIKKVIKGRMQIGTEYEQREQALLLLHSIDTYGIRTKYDYLKLNSKFQQWLQDLEASAELEAALVALDIKESITALKEQVAAVREMIKQRGTNSPTKGKTVAARKAISPEYVALLAFINAAVLCAEDATHFDPLTKTLNGNINYLKTMVLARKGATASDDKEVPASEVQETLPAAPM